MSARRRLTVSALALAAVLSPLGASAQLAADHLSALRPREIGPATMSGRIVDLAVVESDPRIFYVASSTGGVWKTTDNGIRLAPVFFQEAVHSVGDVEVHQKDTSVVWVGTGERASRQSSGWGDGVYKSTDGGQTWRNMGLADSKHIGRIVMHPDDSDVVFVAAMGHLWGANDERGLYKSTDGGGTWRRVLFVDRETGAVDVAMDPSNPSVLYAAMYQRRRRPWGFHGGGPGSALYRSADGGETWTKLTNAGLDNGLPTGEIGRIGITIFRKDPRILYVSVEQGERYNASTAYQKPVSGIYRSENGGESWTFQGTWNPRPMYASQPLVDPNDDQRLYMLNAYSYSDDGGKTFTQPREDRTHGDDRFVWVDPHDSRHVMKADDGGLGISYDRGDHFLYLTHLPLSQWYRVAVDMAHPYNVYGGLQDNGSWAGPNQVYRAEGILNEDWVRWGGGDGFLSLVDTTNNRILYSESQYLGLLRSDIASGQVKDIRPNQPEGFIGDRRNWTTWPDLQNPEQRLGNAMAPGNWDGPFIISPHDPNTLYSGLNELFKSTDRGDTWRSLGDLTSRADRRTLEIMGQRPDSFTLSLDDGIPYWPTLTAIAESEFTPGVLYAGTDDGQVQVSRDDGRTWANVSASVPGLPEMAWINGIHPSKHRDGRLWLVANNYRNDDYANYVWRSDDHGASWTSVVGDLPADRVARTVREDPRNPEVLYLGTELGVFWSWNGGASWVELRGGLPTQAVNDLLVHPRDNDLVLATHGRGIWILDQVNALQEMTPAVAAQASHLFSIEPAEQVRYREERAHTGNMIFEGANPPAAAILDYWLRDEGAEVSITVHDGQGSQVATVAGTSHRGVNRALWDLRHSLPAQGAQSGQGGGGFGRRPEGPLVVPGIYTVRLTAGGVTSERAVRVREDPRLAGVDPLVRAQWTATLLEVTTTLVQAQERAREVSQAVRRLDAGEARAGVAAAAKVRDLDREFGELVSRLSQLAGSADAWMGPLTSDQASQKAFFEATLRTLSSEWQEARGRIRE
ncbi:MAG: hypothetical protein Q8N53_18535 [Longimicrobiales bacterium]|nr:hypothetical protein [Longimicrobiales bacterium]